MAAVLAAAGLAVPGIAQYEGYKAKAYRDLNGKLTKCYGDTSDVVEDRTYSEQECSQSLALAVVKHGLDIAPYLPDDLPPHTLSAFIRVGYNIGAENFRQSSMSRLSLAGDLKGACAAISLYVWTHGKDCRIAANRCGGLPARRLDERRECEQGLAHG